MQLKVSNDHIVSILKKKLDALDFKPDLIIGIGRGGLVPAVYASYYLNLPLTHMGIKSYDKDNKQSFYTRITQSPTLKVAHKKVLVIDDINDTGNTFEVIQEYLNNYLWSLIPVGEPTEKVRYLSVFGKPRSTFKSDVCEMVEDDTWIIFPWDV